MNVSFEERKRAALEPEKREIEKLVGERSGRLSN